MIHQTPINIGGYEHQIRFEVISGEVTMIWILDESFSPENKPPEWLEVDRALWLAFERPVGDYLANLKEEL